MRRRITLCIAIGCLLAAPAASAASLAETRFLIRTLVATLESSAFFVAAFGMAFFLAGLGSRQAGWSAVIGAMLTLAAAGLGYALIGAGLGDVGAGGVLGFPAPITAADKDVAVGVIPAGEAAAGAERAVSIALAALCGAVASDAAFDRSRAWTGVALGAFVGAILFPVAHAWTTADGWIGALGGGAPSPILSAFWIGGVAALAGRIALGPDAGRDDDPLRRRPQRAALSALGVVLAAAGLLWGSAWAGLDAGDADEAAALGLHLAHGFTAALAGFLAGAGVTAFDSRERARSLDGLLAGAVFFAAIGTAADAVAFGWVIAGGALSGAFACVIGPALDRIGLIHCPRGVGLIPALLAAAGVRAIHDGSAAVSALGLTAQALAAAAVAGLIGFALAQSGAAAPPPVEPAND